MRARIPRRLWLQRAAALLMALNTPRRALAQVEYPVVREGGALRFPYDHGSHPGYRTEWWYITGWLRTDAGREFGMQITFFRHRSGVQEDNPSRFAPTQLLFAHAALGDARAGRLIHDERAARAGFGLAQAAEGDTDVRIDRWSLRRTAQGYHARIAGGALEFELLFAPTQPVLLQGRDGFSRKGPLAHQASHYYSVPQLQARGTLGLDGSQVAVSGRAWLDHEWSTEYLAKEAAGWDWTGINLHDGGALMAFRIRDKAGGSLWAGGTWRDPQGRVQVLAPEDISFTPLREWRSPRTGTRYPVAMRLRTGSHVFDLQPLFDDQELDASRSTGTLYWEGATRAIIGGQEAGRGYLELTGYGRRLRM